MTETQQLKVEAGARREINGEWTSYCKATFPDGDVLHRSEKGFETEQAAFDHSKGFVKEIEQVGSVTGQLSNKKIVKNEFGL